MRRTRVHARAENGAAAVEFALVLPVLLTVVFGIISYGYMLSFRQAISQSAAEGARAAAVTFGTDEVKRTRAVSAVTEALASYGLTCTGQKLLRDGVEVGECPVSIAPEEGAGRVASVTINYRYKEESLLPTLPGVPLPERLEYTAVAEVS